jgi:transcriptional regulator with XRE-family HTH domain
MEKFNERLKRLRQIKNLSVKEVANEIGVSTSTYREWEYGRKINGEPYSLLASVFEVDLSELLTGRSSSKLNSEKLEKLQNLCLEIVALIGEKKR